MYFPGLFQAAPAGICFQLYFREKQCVSHWNSDFVGSLPTHKNESWVLPRSLERTP